MARRMTADGLIAALAEGRIVPLEAGVWDAMAGEFPEVSRTPTGLGGPILLIRRRVPGKKTPGWAIVEESKPGERVVRPLPDRKSAQTLIGERLAAYERMWDG